MPPGPEVARQTPSFPVNFAYPQAMNAGFFMADLNETNLVLVLAKRLHHPVDAVAGKSEDDLHAPIDEGFDENICRGHTYLSKDTFTIEIRIARAVFTGECTNSADGCRWKLDQNDPLDTGDELAVLATNGDDCPRRAARRQKSDRAR